MTVKQLSGLLDARILAEGRMDREISCGLCCDVLSMAMAKGRSGAAWLTVQANMNALAVAVMTDAACLIFPEGAFPDEAVVQRARTEGVALLSAQVSGFEAAGRLYAAGLRGEDGKQA